MYLVLLLMVLNLLFLIVSVQILCSLKKLGANIEYMKHLDKDDVELDVFKFSIVAKF